MLPGRIGGGRRRLERVMATDEKLELLKRVPLLSGLGRREIEEVGRLAEEIDLPAGRTLMREGDTGREFFVLVSGDVAIERNGTKIRSMAPGDFFGEIALLDGGPRTATVTADERTRLLVLTRREFHTMMEEFPEVAAEVLNALAHRIRRLEPDQPH
jgi:CRP/FNR family cyclic AMP-dependent transcriptional regulator